MAGTSGIQFNDRLIGALAVAGGAAVIAGTLGFRELPGQQFGSAFFPRIVGSALILTGFALIISAARVPWLLVSDLLRGRAALQVACTLVAVIGWVLVSPVLGFIPATALIVFGLILVAGGRLLPAACTAVGTALLLYAVFGLLLRVPLPYGVIERLLT